MVRSNIRLAGALATTFLVLRVVCIVALAILVPTMLFVWFYPGTVHPGAAMSVNGVAMTSDTPAVAGTMLLFANVILAAAVAVLGKLRAMMRSVVDGAPFTLANVARLRAIAAVMGAMVIFQALSGLLVSDRQRAAFHIDGARFDLGLFLGMLVVLVLAEVFREGVRLAEEAEGTI